MEQGSGKNSFFKRLRNKGGDDNSGQMSFVEHLEVLRWHIMRAAVAVVVAAFVIFFNIDWLFDHVIQAPARKNFVSYSGLCSLSHFLHLGDALCMKPIDIKFQFTTVSGPFTTALNVSMIGGIVASFPYLIWEIWRFVKPALTKKETRYARGSTFWVSLCFFTGVAFGYYLLAPFTFNFLSNFTLGKANINEYRPTIEDFTDTLTNLLLLCGLCFELPVLMFVLAKIGLITSKFLTKNFKYAVVIIVTVAAIITPSPDWISQAIVSMPLLALYGISILVVARTDREKEKQEQQEWS